MVGRTIVASLVVALVTAAGGIASPAATGQANGRIAFGMFGRLIVTNGTGQWPLTAEPPRFAERPETARSST